MPASKFLTPARLTAGVGVLTGLAAAVTAAINVVPSETGAGRALQTSFGLLTTAASVFKFLAGQSAFEVASIQAQNNLDLQAAGHAHDAAIYAAVSNPQPTGPPEANTAELPDEEPIVETPEPDRLVAQAANSPANAS